MRMLRADDIPAFIAVRPAAAILFDAKWNFARYRVQARRSMLNAEAALGDLATFGEIDCDDDVALARSIPVGNVPLIAYYDGGRLVAAKIGPNQDVRGHLERILRSALGA